MREFFTKLLKAIGVDVTDETDLSEESVIRILEEKFKAAEQEAKDMAHDAVLSALVKGQISQSEIEWAMNVALTDVRVFRYCAIELERKRGKVGTLAAAKTTIDDMQRSINRQLGVSDETFLKYNAR